VSAVTQADYNRIVNELELQAARDMGLTPTVLSDVPRRLDIVDRPFYVFYGYRMRRMTRIMDGWCFWAGNTPASQQFISAGPFDRVWVRP
jgi:hypothetical protein